MKIRQASSGPVVALPGAPPELDNGNSGSGQVFVDWSKGPTQKVTLTGNCTLQLYRGLTPGEPTWVQLKLQQDPTGGRVPTFQAVLTAGGTGLTISTAPGSTDLISLYYDGQLLYGTVSGLAFQ